MNKFKPIVCANCGNKPSMTHSVEKRKVLIDSIPETTRKCWLYRLSCNCGKIEYGAGLSKEEAKSLAVSNWNEDTGLIRYL